MAPFVVLSIITVLLFAIAFWCLWKGASFVGTSLHLMSPPRKSYADSDDRDAAKPAPPSTISRFVGYIGKAIKVLLDKTSTEDEKRVAFGLILVLIGAVLLLTGIGTGIGDIAAAIHLFGGTTPTPTPTPTGTNS